jgi:LPS-assembly protein
MGRVWSTVALVVGAALLAAPAPARAQGTLNDAIAARAARTGSDKDQLLLEARELVYDNDRNTVTAVGDVELNYKGRTLQADRVVYDRASGRVTAEGNARLTETDGTVVTASRFELTDDFRSGFIDSLRITQATTDQGRPVTARFSAPRAERIEGETTVFERGTYTACEPCKANPEKPPLWQVKAARIIHNNQNGRSTTRTRRWNSPASRSPTCPTSGRPTRPCAVCPAFSRRTTSPRARSASG